MNEMEWTKSFYTATHLLPERLWRGVFTLSQEDRLLCEEIRLRIGQPLAVTLSGKTKLIREKGGTELVVTREELEETIMRMTKSSLHTYLGQLTSGYFTTEQGHRVGICGQLIYRDGKVASVRDLSSINIRIAKEYCGISDALLPQLEQSSILVLSPPGGGKTTLLRDLARNLSRTMRIAVADERYEIASCSEGVPRFDLGLCDVLSGGSKRDSIEFLLRSMNPEMIVLDEITRGEDAEAVLEGANCGCTFLASAHGMELSELYRRPVYRRLMRAGIFQTIILIENREGKRSYTVRKGAAHAESGGSSDDRRIVLNHGNLHQSEVM